MNRTHRRLAAVVCAGLLAPIGISTATSAAIDQDLVVSATSGAPGDVITVSSASCPPAPEDGNLVDRYLRVALVSGDGSSAVLAGSGWGNGSASFIVPDWVDPADAASIEASCESVTFQNGDFVPSSEAYDPVAFDILPGAGAPTQTSTYSRTSLLTGQSFGVTGTGCPSGAEVYGGADLLAGGDLSGRTSGDYVAGGPSEVTAGDLDAQVDLIQGGWNVSWSIEDGGRPTDITASADKTDIPAGTYTAVPYCGTFDDAAGQGTYLLLPPSLVEVTGTAPIDDLALAIEPGTVNADVVGGSCTAGPVEGTIDGVDLVAASSEFDSLRSSTDRGPSPFGPAPRTTGPSTRAVGHNDSVPFTATPAPDGSWNHADTADFEVGVLATQATCGDPLADGFSYDVAVGVVEVPEPTTTTTTTTVAPQPTPTPATAVAGTPTYAG